MASHPLGEVGLWPATLSPLGPLLSRPAAARLTRLRQQLLLLVILLLVVLVLGVAPLLNGCLPGGLQKAGLRACMQRGHSWL